MAIPRQLKHCVMEVFNKIYPSPIDGDFERAKFVNAWNICFAKIQRNGYAYIDGHSSGSIENQIKLTERGITREIEHNKDTSQRAAQFDRFFEKYRGDL